MYQCGDQVVYGIHGVCQIIDLQAQKIGGKKTNYYVLEPVDQAGTRFFVPSENPLAVAKLRRVLTREEVEMMLTAETTQSDVWIADENQRKQRYRELIVSGDNRALFSMICALHREKVKQLAAGKKFHLCDENFLRDAEKLIGGEFSIVLGIPQGEVAQYIKSRIEES